MGVAFKPINRKICVLSEIHTEFTSPSILSDGYVIAKNQCGAGIGRCLPMNEIAVML